MLKELKVKGKTYALPIFCPDATNASVKTIDTRDLLETGLYGIEVNTFHILIKDIISGIKNSLDIHKFINWNNFVITDSGGFQIMTLIHDKPNFGTIKQNEIIFHQPGKEQFILTPQKSIQIQYEIGSDLIICLDDCTRIEASKEDQEKSVQRTIEWAKICKQEFDKLTKNRTKNKTLTEGVNKVSNINNEKTSNDRPLIFAVIQGGNYKELRKQCFDELFKIGFDGYCFGGYPFDKNGKMNLEIIEYTSSLIPDNFYKYAMGIGKPENIVDCFKCGWQIFDCVIPTREARHEKLYFFNDNAPEILKDILDKSKTNKKDSKSDTKSTSKNCKKHMSGHSYELKDFYYNLSVNNKAMLKDEIMLPHKTCKYENNFTYQYLHYLFKADNFLWQRLATIHNLRFYAKLMEILQEQS